MALVLVLVPFVCGRSQKKRRVDQPKRMQLILGPRWLVPPSSACYNRPCMAQWERLLPSYQSAFSKNSTQVSCNYRRALKLFSSATHPTTGAVEGRTRNTAMPLNPAHLPKGRLRR
jgi:hypothetical protein